MVRIRNIVDWIDSWAPFEYAQAWDNSGLQVGDPEAVAERVMLALDPGLKVLEEARGLGCECLITHHPLLFHPIKAVRTDLWPGNIISRSLLWGIGIIAAHTNIDSAIDGTNAQLVRLLGLCDVRPLELHPGRTDESRYLGMGLYGKLPATLKLEDLAHKMSQALDIAYVRIAGDPGKPVSSAAVCTGSGGGMLEEVLAAGVDVFITGDMRHHDAKLAEESGLALVDVGHFASEKLVLEPLSDLLDAKARGDGEKLEVLISRSERDPFVLIDARY